MSAFIQADFSFETLARARGANRVVGVDEVGRGPLAGPVMAAAVRLDPENIPAGLADSKALSLVRRERLYDVILSTAEVGIGRAEVEEIDRINILQASFLAMHRAIAALPAPAEALIKGDARCLSIAAASIVAKVSRDRLMVELAQQFPGYGWEKNAGYPTKAHRQGLQDLGITPHHRRSFAPIHKML